MCRHISVLLLSSFRLVYFFGQMCAIYFSVHRHIDHLCINPYSPIHMGISPRAAYLSDGFIVRIHLYLIDDANEFNGKFRHHARVAQFFWVCPFFPN